MVQRVLALPAPPDLRVLRGQLALVLPEQQALVDLLDQQAQEQLERQAQAELRVLQVLQAQVEPRVLQVLQALVDRPEQGLLVRLDRPVRPGQVQPVLPDPQGQVDLVGQRGLPEQELRERLDPADPVVLADRLALRDQVVQRGLRVLLDHLGQLERLVLVDQQVLE